MIMFHKAKYCIDFIHYHNTSILLFNVYMPTDERSNGEHLNEYQDILAEISTISRSISTSFIVIAGDFNTDFLRNTPQTRELKSFCESESLISCNNFLNSQVDFCSRRMPLLAVAEGYNINEVTGAPFCGQRPP